MFVIVLVDWCFAWGGCFVGYMVTGCKWVACWGCCFLAWWLVVKLCVECSGVWVYCVGCWFNGCFVGVWYCVAGVFVIMVFRQV